ncbi:FGGY family carbohydrate kinase [Klebsiella pneumoniae]|uniref:FGGY family carbohydrate kinase n=1 Tax=Klebsiella pneumoniae TaxID=573 RepID=UPI002265CFC2|nr:FGGY family carbohydrate kinase [Klebsiella pneumoniae]
MAKRDWSDALLDKCGLSRSQMPTLVEGCEVSATLDPQVAARWGLNASVVVAGGGGDNAVSYTHLDVYKRQRYRQAPRSPAPRPRSSW